MKIKTPNKIVVKYKIPNHLKGIIKTNDIRTKDLEKLDEELKKEGSNLLTKIYEKVIWRINFPNMILDAQNISFSDKIVNIEVCPIHPYRADLSFKKDKTLLRNVCPLTITSILIDKEGYEVLGVRGGDVAQDKIAIVPGGHAEYNPKKLKSNLFPHLLREFSEELGYKYNQSESQTPIVGVFDNEDTKGINVLYITKTSKSYEEIIYNWKNAKDSYEHKKLLKLNKGSLEKLAEKGEITIKSKKYSTTPFFQTCFKNYLEYLKNLNKIK